MLGVPAAGNVPGGRWYASSWIDTSNDLWLFGGIGIDSAGNEGDLNDLWEYEPYPAAAVPAFSLPPGTYNAIQTVAISDATPGATIYYTIDGSAPTTASTLYSGALTIASTQTVNAMAAAKDYLASAVVSAAYTIIVPRDFSVTASPASLTVTAGDSAATNVSIAPQGSFSSSVSFACSGLPAGATCSFSPSSVTPIGPAAATTTLTLSTTTASAALDGNRQPLFPEMALAVTLCCIGWTRRRRMLTLLLLAVSAAGLSLLSGCGGGSLTPASVTSTITITATSGSLSHSTTFSITVN
jgi:hypothetical protein